MSRTLPTLPTPIGIYRRPFFRSATLKWLGAMILVVISFFFLLSLWQRHKSMAVDNGMPCGAAKNDLPMLDLDVMEAADLVCHSLRKALAPYHNPQSPNYVFFLNVYPTAKTSERGCDGDREAGPE
jgi:hypothetical protein